MSIITLTQIKDNFYKVETDLNISVKSVVFSKYIYPLHRYDYDNQQHYWGFGYCMTNLFNNDSFCCDTSHLNWIGSDVPSELLDYINSSFYNSVVYGSGDRGIHFLFPATIQIDTDYSSVVFGALPNYSDIFDDKGLYPELLDNSQQRADALSYILNPDPQKELDPVIWDDTYLKFCRFIEEYNKNVLLLRSTRKVNIENTITTASTDSSSSVNLSGVENKLQSISDKLQTTEIIDNSQKSITDVLNQQANTIQVDEIGLLRSKKGYY